MDHVDIPSSLHFGILRPYTLKQYVIQSRRCGVYPAVNQELVDTLQQLLARYITYDDFQYGYSGFAQLKAQNLTSAYMALYNAQS